MISTSYQLGNLRLSNRIVMPPMTRSRAAKGEIPTQLMAEYYSQRASAGLIISEGTQISQQGQGYAWTPGIYNEEQIQGWRLVTDAVHKAGGHMFAQLWHVGRISHTSFQPNNLPPVAPSALQAKGVKVFINSDGKDAEYGKGEMVQHSMPRALSEIEIKEIVQDFANAAKNAIAAGFDGVELHAANGYLINQFIDSESNIRTDQYGGSLNNRLRFLKEVTQAVSAVIGNSKVGVRISPLTTLQGTIDSTPESTYIGVAKLLDELQICYLHIAEADWEDAPKMSSTFKEALRLVFKGTLIYTGKYTLDSAENALMNGWSDLIGFGRPFIANPDLPLRLINNWSLATPKEDLFFGGADKGYTDYPLYRS